MGQTQDNSSNKYFNRYVTLLAMVGAQSLSISWRRLGLKLCRWDFMASSVTPLVILIRAVVIQWGCQFVVSTRSWNSKRVLINRSIVCEEKLSVTFRWQRLGEIQKKKQDSLSLTISWPTNLLGPKPVEQIADLVQKSADGQMIVGDRYGFPWVVGCSNNPHRRQLHRKMVVPVSIAATKPFEFTWRIVIHLGRFSRNSE